MTKLPYKPTVENRYSLTYEDIKNLKMGDRETINNFFHVQSQKTNLSNNYFRNDIISAWCIIGCTYCGECEFWIGFYDENAPKPNVIFEHNGDFHFHLSSYQGACWYRFNEFYSPEEINGDTCKLTIQEKFLETINELLDNGVLIQ